MLLQGRSADEAALIAPYATRQIPHLLQQIIAPAVSASS